MAGVNVKIGADTSDLETELAIAQRQTQLAANEMRKLADAYIRGKGALMKIARHSRRGRLSQMPQKRELKNLPKA